jgi:hypothetical protein
MKLTVGKTTFTIPDKLIDCDDFARKAYKIAPTSIHFNSDMTVVFNWRPNDLREIAKKLHTYDEIKRRAREAGCNATSALAKQIGRMYDTMYRDEVRKCLIQFASDQTALAVLINAERKLDDC